MEELLLSCFEKDREREKTVACHYVPRSLLVNLLVAACITYKLYLHANEDHFGMLLWHQRFQRKSKSKRDLVSFYKIASSSPSWLPSISTEYQQVVLLKAITGKEGNMVEEGFWETYKDGRWLFTRRGELEQPQLKDDRVGIQGRKRAWWIREGTLELGLLLWSPAWTTILVVMLLLHQQQESMEDWQRGGKLRKPGAGVFSASPGNPHANSLSCYMKWAMAGGLPHCTPPRAWVHVHAYTHTHTETISQTTHKVSILSNGLINDFCTVLGERENLRDVV